MISFFKDFKTGSFQITLDGGRENHNKTRISPNGDSFDVILGNIKKLAKAGIKVLLRINATHNNIESIKEIINIINNLPTESKKYISVTIQQVWQDKTDMLEKIWEHYGLIHESGFRISPRPYRRMSYLCYGDKKNTAVVNYNGNVYKCTALDFDKIAPAHTVFEGDWLNSLQNRFEEQKQERSDKQECYACRVFPLCTGGCQKHHIMTKGQIQCPYPTNEDKDRLIYDVVRERIMMDAVYT